MKLILAAAAALTASVGLAEVPKESVRHLIRLGLDQKDFNSEEEYRKALTKFYRSLDDSMGKTLGDMGANVQTAVRMMKEAAERAPLIERTSGNLDFQLPDEEIGEYGVVLETFYRKLNDDLDHCNAWQTLHIHHGRIPNRETGDYHYSSAKHELLSGYLEPCEYSAIDLKQKAKGRSARSRSRRGSARIRSIRGRRNSERNNRSMNVALAKNRRSSTAGPMEYEPPLGYKAHLFSDDVLSGKEDVVEEYHHFVDSGFPIRQPSAFNEGLQPELRKKMVKLLNQVKSDNADAVLSNIKTAQEVLVGPDSRIGSGQYKPVDPSPRRRQGEDRSVVFATSYYKLEDKSCVVEQIIYIYDVVRGISHQPQGSVLPSKTWPSEIQRDPWEARIDVLVEHLGDCNVLQKATDIVRA